MMSGKTKRAFDFNAVKKNSLNIILCFILAAVTSAVVMKELNFVVSDYYQHLQYAVNLKQEFSCLFTDISKFPHQILYPLWHILVYIFCNLGSFLFGRFDPSYAAALVTALINVCTFLLQEKILSRNGCSHSVLVAFGLSFVMPIFISGLSPVTFYFGQSSPVSWLNPTNMTVKPFALAAFFLITEILDLISANNAVPRKKYLKLSGLTFISVFAKPSFFQGIVPALGLYILIRLFRNRFRNVRSYFSLCACFVPAFLVILMQYLIAFFYGKGGEGIGIGWLEVAKVFYPHPAAMLILALFFPFCFILFNTRMAMKRTGIRFSLVYVLCSWLEFALLYERGDRKLHGNFEWTLFLAYAAIWLVTSMMFFKDRQTVDGSGKAEKVKNSVLLLLWLLHLIFGIIYLWKFFAAEELLF